MSVIELESKSEPSYESFIRGQVEFEKVAEDCHYFLSQYAWIQNKNTAQTVKWESWGYLDDLLHILLTYPDIIILKARQLGISWLVSGYALWKSLYSDSAKCLMMSGNESKAWDLVAKAKFIWGKLPESVRLSLGHDTKSWLDYTGNNSTVMALPSTQNAGRGTDATVVIRDELAEHPYGRDNFTAISPAIDSGGQLIDLSTINKLDPDNHFTERVRRALLGAKREDFPSGLSLYTGGESGAVLVFLPWTLRPVRLEGMELEEWFELKVRPKYTPLEIEQEYPRTIEDALRPSETRSFFDIDATEQMMLDVDAPIKTQEINIYDGMVRVFKLPVVGRKYVCATDPSDGKDDPFVTIVLDPNTGECVCTATGKRPADDVARIHDYLTRAYNNAYNSGEVNAYAGGKFQQTVNELETPNQAPRRTPEGKIKTEKGGTYIRGWYTTPQHRDLMLDGLEEATRRRLITVHDREAINELRAFMRPEGEKARASQGEHDDWVMCMALAWQLQKYIPKGTFKITSTKYRD